MWGLQHLPATAIVTLERPVCVNRRYEPLTRFLAQSRHLIWSPHCPRGGWLSFRQDTAEITDACARKYANNFSSTLGPIVNPSLTVIICSSWLTGGKGDKIHPWVRAVVVITYLTARKKSLKITFFPFLWIFKLWSIFMFPKEENSIRQCGIWLIFFSRAFKSRPWSNAYFTFVFCVT